VDHDNKGEYGLLGLIQADQLGQVTDVSAQCFWQVAILRHMLDFAMETAQFANQPALIKLIALLIHPIFQANRPGHAVVVDEFPLYKPAIPVQWHEASQHPQTNDGRGLDLGHRMMAKLAPFSCLGTHGDSPLSPCHHLY